MSIQLIKYKKLTGKIKLVTGLHIGGSKDEIRIGETDNPVIKNPIDNYPYIPGSSLKGKIRTLLEWHLGLVDEKGDVHGCTDNACPICRLFGSTKKESEVGPGRVIFRDCSLDVKSKSTLLELKNEKGLMYVEEKYENVIDRAKGTTKVGGLRLMERVPAGMFFDFEMDYRVFDYNNDKGKRDEDYFNVILHGLWLLQNDALGGSGSRGYGQIVFEGLKDEDGVGITLEDKKINETLKNPGK